MKISPIAAVIRCNECPQDFNHRPFPVGFEPLTSGWTVIHRSNVLPKSQMTNRALRLLRMQSFTAQRVVSVPRVLILAEQDFLGLGLEPGWKDERQLLNQQVHHYTIINMSILVTVVVPNVSTESSILFLLHRITDYF